MGDAAALGSSRIPQVVGREAERLRIHAFATGLAGGLRALILRGEAGIGKTALWLEAVDLCRSAELEVLITRPAEEEIPLGAVGLVDLFEHAGLDPEVLRGDDDPLARGRAVLEALRGLAAHRPVVIAIDDVQWLDSVSARALRYALRRLDSEPVGMLLSARLGSGEPDPLGAATILRPGRCEELELGPLSLGALRSLLGRTVEAISRPTMRRIHEVSGGNPLYALELARGLGADSGLALPSSLQAAIAQRLETVSGEVGDLLQTVSALGPTSVDDLRETLPDTDVDALLAAASGHGVLVVEEDLAVRFSHPLLASAVYGRMSPLARRSLHARLAGRALHPDLRARHLARSTDEPDAEVAALLEAAAGRAVRRGASDLAAEYAGHSVRLTPADDLEDARRRTLMQIESFAAAGESQRALELADRLVAALPPGPGRAEALVQRADLDDDDAATAEALLLHALEEAGADDRLRGLVLETLSKLRRMRIGDLPGAVESAREALALAERSGDVRLEARAAAYLATLQASAGVSCPGLIERAVALEEETGGILLAPGPSMLFAKQLFWDGELERARALHEAAHATAVRAGNDSLRPQRFYDLALVEWAAGNFGDAEELARHGIEAARDAESTTFERELLHPLALAQAALGRADDARASAARLRDEAERRGRRPLGVRAQCIVGLLALSEGRDEEAASILGPAAEEVEAMGFANPGAFPVLPDAIEAFARAGERSPAAGLLERLAGHAEAVSTPWAIAACDRARGIVLLAEGRADDAAEPLVRAELAFERLGCRPDAARATLTRGRALLRGGHRTLAADALADARSRFAAMGAALWEARAADELERAAPGRAAGELTPTERRVAALVAQGQKNREIAAALFMSVGSVEAHLTRIYRKLAIRSRSELAGYMGGTQGSPHGPPPSALGEADLG